MATTAPGSPYVESSDLVANYPAVSEALAERVDLVGVLPFASAAARTTALPTPTDGQYSYLQDTNATEFYNGSAWTAVAGGKILQVVRATDSTARSTTSTAFVDASLSVTITPTKATSTLLVLHIANAYVAMASAGVRRGVYQITDSSNVALDGAQGQYVGLSLTYYGSNEFLSSLAVIGYAAPATTSPVTYKARFRVEASGVTTQLANNLNTGQLYAIEVSA